MDVIAIIQTIAKVVKTAVDLTPAVISVVQDAEPFAKQIYNLLSSGKPITQTDLNELEQRIAELSAQLQQPLPAETEDDV